MLVGRGRRAVHLERAPETTIRPPVRPKAKRLLRTSQDNTGRRPRLALDRRTGRWKASRALQRRGGWPNCAVRLFCDLRVSTWSGNDPALTASCGAAACGYSGRDPRGAPTCEHVPFHTCLHQGGLRIGIAPFLRSVCGPRWATRHKGQQLWPWSRSLPNGTRLPEGIEMAIPPCGSC